MTLDYVDHLLPGSATLAEQALSAGLNRDAILGPPIDAVAGWRFARPLPAGFGPWLVEEYQLGSIRRFFPTDEDCIDAGWPWQRLRGTLTAVDRAMGWIGYDAAMVEPPQVRRR
ncbi:MAG: phage tail protein, partial [Pseudomonadota bacterium]